MARSPDDDAPHRMRHADEWIARSMNHAAGRENPDSNSAPETEVSDAPAPDVAGELASIRDLQREIGRLERDLNRARSIVRLRRVLLFLAGIALLAGLSWTAQNWQRPSRYVATDVFCGALIVLCIGAAIADARWRRPEDGLVELEDQLEVKREAARIITALRQPPLAERRKLYRTDVASVIEQYETDSRKYRRIHNRLQTLIMVGSASTTTIAALDTGKELTWQSTMLTGISFAITVAAMFTGYYKFRERSYFLQQTADAIEEEANAVTLGIGPYSEYGPGQEDEALKLFTQRVEDHRNEQRRRQQQLDQPADQATPSSQPPAA